MKVYKFIFIVGFLNLVVPFLGIPFFYKNFTLITLACVTLGYALIVRAVEKERAEYKASVSHKKEVFNTETIEVQKTIEEVVDMVEEKKPVVSDGVVKRRGRKPKVIAEQKYE